MELSGRRAVELHFQWLEENDVHQTWCSELQSVEDDAKALKFQPSGMWPEVLLGSGSIGGPKGFGGRGVVGAPRYP